VSEWLRVTLVLAGLAAYGGMEMAARVPAAPDCPPHIVDATCSAWRANR
jgi:hypothetical protein